MADVALYYPYIDPPSNAWTIRSLLYWDRIDAIVPEGVALQPSTQELLDTGLLRCVPWWDVMAPAYKLAPALIDYTHEIAKRPVTRLGLSPQQNHWSRIHVMKMPHDFLAALRDTSLGEPIDDYWWRVRPDIATHYMTALAYGVAKNHALPMDLLTDTVLLRGDPGAPLRLKNSVVDYATRGASWELNEVLKTLFPVPRTSLPLKALVKFKRTYGAQLPQFRAKVHYELEGVRAIQDPKARQERLRDLTRLWKEESDAIQRQLAPSGITFMQRAILPSMVGLATYAVAPDRLDLTAILPLVCVLGQAALDATLIPRDQAAAINPQPMAYAAMFGRQMSRMPR